MKKYTFPRGGLPFNDSTAPQKSEAINAYLPSLSVISMTNGNAKVFPIVAVGETVREGMLIGRASGAGAANMHSPVPGRVVKKIAWKDNDNIDNEALVIKMEGSFEKLGRKLDIMQWKNLSGYDLQRIISDYGIIEMEDTGRPLSDLISTARRENDSLTLVVRCVFDDPWLVADYALCRDRISAVIEGAAIVAKACLKVTQIIFAVSHTEKEIGDMLLSEAGRLETPSSVVFTGSRYPQSNSRELELALRNYEKKEGLSIGSLLILGPAVLAAANDAVVHRRPVLDRYVAVGGAAVKKPQILKVRIGTRVRELIEQCGGFSEAPHKIVMGSPLSGREIMYLDEPVSKTCYAVVAMSKAQVAFRQQQNCINCGDCRSVCPVGLDPQNVYKKITALDKDDVHTTGCHGCGCCEIVCPSALPLMETFIERDQESSSPMESSPKELNNA